MIELRNRRLFYGMIFVLSCCLWMGEQAEARPGQGTETVVVTDVAQSIPHRQRETGRANAVVSSIETILQQWTERHERKQEEKREKNVGIPKKDVSGNIMHLWNVHSVTTGGTLLFSDSPESVTQDGILYTDRVSGDARILFYHLNSTGQPKKVAVVLENISDQMNEVKVTRGGMSEPDDNYLSVGKATQAEYFNTRLEYSIHLLKGSCRLLQPGMNQVVLQPGELVYGVYDFIADHPVRVSVIMYPVWEDPLAFLHYATILPKDEQRLRGTFHGMNRKLSSSQSYDPSKDGIVYFPIGDNHHDRYLYGIDATDGSRVINYGNYGVLYQIQIPTKGTQKTKFFLSPLGGVYAGAMTVQQNGGRPSLLLTPRERLYFGDGPVHDSPQAAELEKKGMTLLTEYTELADLGTYRSNTNLSFEYSPPGASNLPVNIILMPANGK